MPNKEIIALEKELEKLRLELPCSELVSVLNKLALAEIHSDPCKSEASIHEALDLAEKLELPVEQAKSYNILGIINCEGANFPEAMSYCRKSMEICEKLGDESGMASIHGTIALIYRAQGMIDKALEHHHESLRRKLECGAGEDELARCYFNIGACYSILLRLDLAQSSYEYARKIWEDSGDRQKLAYLYNNIGCIHEKEEELDKAYESFQKSLEIREDLGDKKGIASILSNLGGLREDLGDNESALDFYIRSLEMYEEIGNRRGIAYICGCIGGIYTKMGRLDEAEELIVRGLDLSRKLEIKDWEIHCLEKITDLYMAKGDWQKALQHSRELKTCVEEHLNEKVNYSTCSVQCVIRLQGNTTQKVLKPAIPVATFCNSPETSVVLPPAGLEKSTEVKKGSGKDCPVNKEQSNKKPTQSPVSIKKRVNGLKLIVYQSYAH